MHGSRIEELRQRAERCLASNAPSAAEAHELASLALTIVALVESIDPETPNSAHPYRGRAPNADAAPLAASASLERALTSSQARVRELEAELAERRDDRE